jgi:hypothetical protein
MTARAHFCALFVTGSVVFLPSHTKVMLSFRWDTLVVAVMLGVTAGALALQVALRANLARLLQAFRLARRSAGDEPNLYDLVAERRSPTTPAESRRRRVS